MPDAPTSRFYLADLVMAVLTCGLVAALFTGGRGPSDAAWIFVSIVVVATVWASFRANRRAPTCEDCGRRFLPPDPEKPRMLGECPRCGRAQELRAAAIRRWKGISRFLLAGCVAAVGAAAIMEAGLDNKSTLYQGRPHLGPGHGLGPPVGRRAGPLASLVG